MPRTKVAGVVNISADGETLAVSTSANDVTPPKKSQRGRKAIKSPKSPLKFLDPDTNTPCKICTKVVDSSPKSEAIECDYCKTWVHFNCSKLTRNEYDFLMNTPLTQVLWYCKKCKTDMKNGGNGQDDRISQNGAKIDTFMNIITTMQKEMTEIKQQMTKVVENTSQTEGADDEKLSSQTAQMQSHVSETLSDQHEKEEKKNNVIVYNVPETAQSDDKTEMIEDLKTVKEIVSVVLPNVDNVTLCDTNVMRLGRRIPGKTRPIKIQFKDDFTKGKIFRNSVKLRNHDKYKNVNISNDKTKKELMADRILKDKLEAAKLARPGEDLIIYRGNIMPRKDRPAKV